MKKVLILSMALLVLLGCKSESEYKSVVGVWTVEEHGEITPFRRYSLSIRRHEAFDSVYVITNFFRTADGEALIEVKKLNILVRPQIIGSYNVRGEGAVRADFKRIDMKFYVYNQGIEERVEAFFSR